MLLYEHWKNLSLLSLSDLSSVGLGVFLYITPELFLLLHLNVWACLLPEVSSSVSFTFLLQVDV